MKMNMMVRHLEGAMAAAAMDRKGRVLAVVSDEQSLATVCST